MLVIGIIRLVNKVVRKSLHVFESCKKKNKSFKYVTGHFPQLTV